MTCTCGASGVYNEVSGKSFYYCRSCKVEIDLVEPYNEPTKLSQKEIDDLFTYIPTGIDFLDDTA